MRWGLTAGCVAIAALAVSALTASAQQAPDPPICNTNLREWGGLAGGSNAAAMRDLLARTPNACRELRGQISARIAALAPAPVRSSPAPTDPCTSARVQWRRIETSGTLEQVRAYLAAAPTSCNAERSAAQTRLAALEEAARPTLPAQYAAVIEQRVSSQAAREWLARQNARASVYFRPHIVTTTIRSESGYIGADNNVSCPSFSWLPADSRRDASVSDYTTETRRDAAFFGAHRETWTGRLCSSEAAENTSQRHSTIINWGTSLETLYSNTSLQISGIVDADPNSAAQRRFDVSSLNRSTSGQSYLSDRSDTCLETRRYAPGEWRPEFPFTILALACDGRFATETGSQVTSSNIHVSPELMAILPFVDRAEYLGRWDDTQATTSNVPSNVIVTSDDRITRITFDLDSTVDIVGPYGSMRRSISRNEITYTMLDQP